MCVCVAGLYNQILEEIHRKYQQNHQISPNMGGSCTIPPK